MRLTCPRCGAQYEIDGSAIPAAGRAVECSACGHVWHHAPGAQGGRAAQAAEPPARAPEAFLASERPRLHRPLDESVLSVLREEAAREIEARRRDLAPEAEEDDPDYSPPPLPAPGTDPATDAATGALQSGNSEGEHDWPATTVTHAAPPASANILARRLEAELEEDRPSDSGARRFGGERAQPLPHAPASPPTSAGKPVEEEVTEAPADTITTPADPFPAPLPTAAAAAISAAPAVRTANTGPAAAPSPHIQSASAASQALRSGRRSGYAAGFGLAAMTGVILLALYALAPRVADQGELGGRLMDYRADVDRGRAWLDVRANALVSGIRE